MTKFSKILLCICLSIICICGVVSNTYCGVNDAPKEFYSITLDNDLNFDNINKSYITPDIYNLYSFANLNYTIKCTHLTNDNQIFDMRFSTFPDWVNNVVDNFDGKITEIYYPIKAVESFKYKISYSLYKWGSNTINDNWIAVYLDKIELLDNSYVFNLDPSVSNITFGISTSLVPYFSSSVYGVTEVYSYYSGSISFDIINSDNYYYSNAYNFVLSQGGFVNSNGLTITLTNSNNLIFSKTFNENISNEFKKSYSGCFTFINNYDSARTFLKSIEISEDFSNQIYKITDYLYSSSYLMSKFVSTTDYGSYRYYFSQYNVDNNSDIKSSSTIPIGSNQFYKNAAWYDIPTHLYNFFIYLIFDAPIISNFTKLAMVIISFLVETFNFVIGLFNGVSNIFFVSIFVGMLALIFLLKIIFGGKT